LARSKRSNGKEGKDKEAEVWAREVERRVLNTVTLFQAEGLFQFSRESSAPIILLRERDVYYWCDGFIH